MLYDVITFCITFYIFFFLEIGQSLYQESRQENNKWKSFIYLTTSMIMGSLSVLLVNKIINDL